MLFARTTRSTRLTRAGKLFSDHVPRVFAALQQARDSVKAAANGFHGQLRIALSDGIRPSRLPALLALCRQEEPEVEIRLTEVPLAQQIKGLHDDLYDVGFVRADDAGDSIVALPVWNDPLMVAVPARHPCWHKSVDMEPLVAERVASCDLMMALVSAGFALGLTGAAHIVASREQGVVARPLAGCSPVLTSYLLRLDGEPSETQARFIKRVQAIDSPEAEEPPPEDDPDSREEPEP